ncbi:MAG: hypothetical protein COB50_03550 [Thiotrichales bacterium]|nr:MAG: hypothetical protein COB50_03550 [Thiotrichales bacterium]
MVIVPIAITIGLALTAAATALHLAIAIVLGTLQGIMTLFNSFYQEIFCKQGSWNHKLQNLMSDKMHMGKLGKVFGHVFALVLFPITAMLRMLKINPKPFKGSYKRQAGNVSTCVTFSDVIGRLSGKKQDIFDYGNYSNESKNDDSEDVNNLNEDNPLIRDDAMNRERHIFISDREFNARLAAGEFD